MIYVTFFITPHAFAHPPTNWLLWILLVIIVPRLYQLLHSNIHLCSTRNIQYDGNGWNGFFLWPNGWKSSRQHRNTLIWKILSPSLGAVWPLSVHPSHYVDGEECADLTELFKVEIYLITSFCWSPAPQINTWGASIFTPLNSLKATQNKIK